jgi:site-specific recombinase XerD
MTCRDHLADGERKIEAFLTDLAVRGKVAPSTQNQAMNALVFLYRQVLEQPLDEKIDAIRAERSPHVPVVLTREEVGKVIPLMERTPQLVVKILYGSGLRVTEALRLRIKDVDFAMRQVTVRSGKGDRDRVTTLADRAVRAPGLSRGRNVVAMFPDWLAAKRHRKAQKGLGF